MRTRTAVWYETTVRYERLKDDGNNNIATESYAVDALSFAEAEQRITEEMEPYCSGEFDVKKNRNRPVRRGILLRGRRGQQILPCNRRNDYT